MLFRSDAEHLFMSVSHLYVFGRMTIQVLCPFFGWVVFDVELYVLFV